MGWLARRLLSVEDRFWAMYWRFRDRQFERDMADLADLQERIKPGPKES